MSLAVPSPINIRLEFQAVTGDSYTHRIETVRLRNPACSGGLIRKIRRFLNSGNNIFEQMVQINCFQENSTEVFSLSPGQVQLFDKTFTFRRPMSDSVDAQILESHDQGAAGNMICSFLPVGPNRVSRVLDVFRHHHQLPPRAGKGRPKKVTRDILDFIDIRTIQSTMKKRINCISRMKEI
jgi:hypothetical protein